MNEFDRIYTDRVWVDKPGAPPSGSGSLPHNVKPVVKWIKALRPVTICDIGCGDLTWLDQAATQIRAQYTGIDVSSVALGLASQSCGGGRVLLRADASEAGFAVIADMVIVKDVFFHLPDEKVKQLLLNLGRSTWRYLIVNSDNVGPIRGEFNCAQWAMVNLELFVEFAGLGGKVMTRTARPEHGEYLLICREDPNPPTI